MVADVAPPDRVYDAVMHDRRRIEIALLLSLLASGCGEGVAPPGGGDDGSTVDGAAARDLTAPGIDLPAARRDALTEDAGVSDLAATDAGAADAGIGDGAISASDQALDLLAPGGDGPRDLAIAADLVPPPPRRIFAAPRHHGDFGGVDGAHLYCQQAAKAAALGGTYRAILGSPGGSPIADLMLAGERAILRPDGVTVATDATFWAMSHLAAIDRLADGKVVDASCAWTGFGANGVSSNATCGGWTKSGGGETGQVGSPDLANVKWFLDRVPGCNSECHVYCIER